MEKEPKSTPSEQVLPEALDSFETAMQILADLPTDRAMQDLSKARWGSPAIKQVIETMALQKMDLVKCMRLIHMRERILMRMMDTGTSADKAIKEWLKENPNYTVELKPA